MKAHDGRPLDLPLVRAVESLNFKLGPLRASLRTKKSLGRSEGSDDGGFRDPLVGELLGPRLSERVGALLSRPVCVFANSFVWLYQHGSVLHEHTDRNPLDITMSIPIVLDGADGWPLLVRQPNGEVLECPSELGTFGILDGRWRTHWRPRFTGERAVMLLLHWQAPAVLWPRMLDAAECARLRAGGASAVTPDALERCATLARLSVPPCETPQVSLCDNGLRALTPGDGNRADARFLVALDGGIEVSFEVGEPVSLAPGDGLAFPAREACTLNRSAAEGGGRALLGHAPSSVPAPSTPSTKATRHVHEVLD